LRRVIEEREYSTQYGLSCYRQLNEMNGRALFQKVERERLASAESPSALDRLVGSHAYTEAQSILPRISRNAIAVMLCSFVDEDLLGICLVGATDEKSRDKVQKVRRDGHHDKIVKLLRSTWGSKDLPEWLAEKKLRDRSKWEVYRVIRNAIVHDGGFLDGERVAAYDSLCKSLEWQPALTIETWTKRICLFETFIPNMIDDIDAMFRELYHVLYRRVSQA